MSKLFIFIRRGLRALLLATASSHDEVSSVGLSNSSSVLFHVSLTLGLEFALVSDLSAVGHPLVSEFGLRLGLVNGSLLNVVVEASSLEAESARSSVSLDDFSLSNLGVEEGKTNGVESEANDLTEDVPGLELNVESIVKVLDVEFSSPGLASEVVVTLVGLGVVVDQKRNHLHPHDEENAEEPDSDHDLSHSVEEDMELRVNPADAGEGPSEQHGDPGEHVEVESDERRTSPDCLECVGVPRGEGVFHVLTLVDVEVVQNVEAGEGSVDGPSHVPGDVHHLFLSFLLFGAFPVGSGEKHLRYCDFGQIGRAHV